MTDLRTGREGRQVTRTEWRQCRAVARAHGRTFFFASQFLPPHRRRAIHAAYAFCRVTDDIVDRAPATGLVAAAQALDAWEAELDAPRHPIAVAFAAVRETYGIPVVAARDLLSGVRMDLTPCTYETWDDLALYCYRVAGTVGLIAAPILGCRDPAALPHAINLGIAMQLTNVLRDVAEDGRMGRLYLPLADLAASYEEAIIDVLAAKTMRAARRTGARSILIAGGVAANRGLRDRLRLCVAESWRVGEVPEVRWPDLSYCTDNAAMVAGLGFDLYRRGARTDLHADAFPRFPLGTGVPMARSPG